MGRHQVTEPFIACLVQESAQLQKPELQGCIRTHAVEEQLQQSTPDAMKTCQGCSKLYLQAPLARLLAQARANIDAVWAQHGPSTCVMLDGGNLFWAGNLVTSANLAASAAASLRFPPHIEAIAEKVANSIGPVFNGVHLRWALLLHRKCRLRTLCVAAARVTCPPAVPLHASVLACHFSRAFCP